MPVRPIIQTGTEALSNITYVVTPLCSTVLDPAESSKVLETWRIGAHL